MMNPSRIQPKCMMIMDKTDTDPVDTLSALDVVLAQRRQADPHDSYTASLYTKGVDAINDKISEEAAEVVEAARTCDDAHVIHEVADLWFHCLVLLQSRNLASSSVMQELAGRFGMSGHEEKSARTQTRESGR